MPISEWDFLITNPALHMVLIIVMEHHSDHGLRASTQEGLISASLQDVIVLRGHSWVHRIPKVGHELSAQVRYIHIDSLVIDHIPVCLNTCGSPIVI